MTQISMIFNDFAIVTVKRNDNRINFSFMTKSKAENRMKNADLSEKKVKYDYKKIIIYYKDVK